MNPNINALKQIKHFNVMNKLYLFVRLNVKTRIRIRFHSLWNVLILSSVNFKFYALYSFWFQNSKCINFQQTRISWMFMNRIFYGTCNMRTYDGPCLFGWTNNFWLKLQISNSLLVLFFCIELCGFNEYVEFGESYSQLWTHF